MGYDRASCPMCPYFCQAHLADADRTARHSPPVELEAHQSHILIVLQAPGVEEWTVGQPLQPTRKRGGTAGARVAKSWEATGKKRTDFDIINSVQCFPGVDGDRDAAPTPKAISACKVRLEAVILAGNYKNVVTFGAIAKKAAEDIRSRIGGSYVIDDAPHPNGGVSTDTLNALWSSPANPKSRR